MLPPEMRVMVGGIGDGAASAVSAVINLAAFGGTILGHPVGAAFEAANIVAIDAGAGMADTARKRIIRL